MDRNNFHQTTSQIVLEDSDEYEGFLEDEEAFWEEGSNAELSDCTEFVFDEEPNKELRDMN